MFERHDVGALIQVRTMHVAKARPLLGPKARWCEGGSLARTGATQQLARSWHISVSETQESTQHQLESGGLTA